MDFEKKIDDLLRKLTLKEKTSLLSGKDIWNTVPIDRLEIPSIVMTDGPHGVRASNPEVGREVKPTTAFPTGISMGASWNPKLIEQVGQALGEETRAMGCDVLLGPCVNIVRYPLGGRNFETFSEDPYHAGKTAVAYINGVQSRGVGTSLKHYALNNYEIERFRASTRVDERTMQEIYLPAFEMAVKEAKPWTVMCSYNRINGIYASENAYLLRTILKEEWGFDGAVISDWGAVHSVFESVKNGLDLEMPGPAKYYQLLEESALNWQIAEDVVTEAVRRVLKLIARTGRMTNNVSKGSVNTVEHQAIARKLAEEAIVLLKNKGDILPLDKKDLKTLAIIGPNAANAVIEGGGSSRVNPPYRVSPLESLRQVLGDKVELAYEEGCDNYKDPFEIQRGWLNPDGLKGTFFVNQDFSGDPILTQDGFWPEFWFHTGWSAMPEAPAAARWEGELTVPESGDYQLQLAHNGKMRILLDGKLVLESSTQSAKEHKNSSAICTVKGKKKIKLAIEYQRHLDEEVIFYRLGLGAYYDEGADPRFDRAIILAKSADKVVFMGGMPDGYETEGDDRSNMELPGRQNELISAIAKVNPRTVVVLNTGAPVSMPWADDVAGIVEAFFPGLENGNALVKILMGDVNPSGKLPVTFPKRLQDSPAFINASYPGCREVNYGEGIFVGYRYFDKVEVEPLFPFGHGLSYTQFKFGKLTMPSRCKLGEILAVSMDITNSGDKAGAEVIQLYVSDSASSLVRPIKELKGFEKVFLKAGETKTVTFQLDDRSFAFYDPDRRKWVAEPGEFEILTGSSSKDIRSRKKFDLIK
jgi:beta-glucosidase